MKFLLSFFLTVIFTVYLSGSSFGGCQIYTVNETSPPSDVCNATWVTITGQNEAIYALDQIYYTISGSTITINVAYVGTTVLFLVQPFTHNVDLGTLPAGNYTLVVNGITNSNIASTITDSLTVQPSPVVASFTYPQTICLGDSVQLSNTSTGATSNLWYVDGAQVSSNVNHSFMPSSPGNVSIVLRVIYGSCQQILQGSILVNDAPTIDSLSASETTICFGESFDLMSSSSGATTMEWFENGAFLSNVANPTVTPVTDGSMIYEFVVSNGVCSSDTMQTVVSVLPLPSIDDFTVSDTVICIGNSVDFTSSSSNANNFEWFENGISAGNSSTLIATPNPEGIYDYTLLLELNGCFDSIQQSVEVVGLPSVDLGADTNNCFGPIVLDAGPGMSSYVWQDQSTNQTFTPTTMGIYSVTVTDMNGCSAYDEMEFESCAGIEEDDATIVQVYPNPASDFVQISTGKYSGEAKLILRSSNGAVISTETMYTSGIIHMNINELDAGIYFIQLQLDTSIKTVRLIKK